MSRYAVGTQVNTGNATISFWSANAGSYMFPDAWRPNSISSCSGYNNYARGTANRNRYMNQVTAGQLLSAGIARSIYWTVGANDTATVDTACGDQVQGTNRVERWEAYTGAMRSRCFSIFLPVFGATGAETYCGQTLGFDQRVRKISGCGHGHGYSWGSGRGRNILFYWD